MAWIEGGMFLMGSDEGYPEEAPARSANTGGFWIDRHPVTNRDFNRFAQETGHVTLAERPAARARTQGRSPAPAACRASARPR